MGRNEIRKAYDKNYQEMLEVIRKIGGENNIPDHRIKKTRLYQKLRELQKNEHRLTKMEESLSGNS